MALTSDSLTCLTPGLSSGSPGLQVKLLTSVLQSLQSFLRPPGEVDVDGGSHPSPEVGGAGVDVAVLLGQGVVLAGLSLDTISDSLDTAGEAGEDSLDIASLLHGDDTGLILLVDPHKEGLGVIVEDSTTLGPVTLHTSNLNIEN